MEVTTYTNFRQNLKSFLDNVFSNHDPLFVKRTNGEDVVVLSQSDYNSMQETLYLLGNPNNARFLSESIKEVEEGKTVKYSLSDLKKLGE